MLQSFLLLCTLLVVAASGRAAAQNSEPRCQPIAQRNAALGCWIVIDDPIGELPSEPMFWHLDTYPDRVTADAAKGPRGTVIESLGKVWLLTIAAGGWRSGTGQHMSDIGPLPVRAGVSYSAMYMEAIFAPGMTASEHTHSGPEAWFTLTGETCLETPDGVTVGRAGGPPVIVPEGPPMHLTATGKVERRAIVLILHDQSKPATTMTHAWTPKGLCTAR